MKKQAIVFAGPDEMAARAFALPKRDAEWNCTVGSAYSFNGSGGEHIAYIMPDVPKWHRERIQAAYKDTVLVDAPKSDNVISFPVSQCAPLMRTDSHLRTIKLGRPGRPRASA